MPHPFDLVLSGGKSIGSTVLEPLVAEGIVPAVSDVGARNGMFTLPESYTRHARLIGFEPNPDEYRKLVDGRTDAMAAGIRQPQFKELKYFDCAVWDREEERDFYLTAGDGACTLMGETDGKITERMFLDAAGFSQQESYKTLHTAIKRTEKVKCRPLDALVQDEVIDFLKLDIEGAELRALKGANNLIEGNNILFIKTEFMMIKYYEEHPIFGYLHCWLSERGFRLVHIENDKLSYSRSPTSIPSLVDRRLNYAGEAYFILDPDRVAMSPQHLQRLAAISLVHGFRSLAVSLLRDAGLLSRSQVDEIEGALSHVSFKIRMLDAWGKFPLAVQRRLLALGLRV